MIGPEKDQPINHEDGGSENQSVIEELPYRRSRGSGKDCRLDQIGFIEFEIERARGLGDGRICRVRHQYGGRKMPNDFDEDRSQADEQECW